MPRSVLFKTSLTANTGYGNDGFALAAAMSQNGFDVRLAPSSVVPPIPYEVALMLVKPLDSDFDLVLHHVDPANLGLKDGEERIKGKKIAWTMWEFTDFPEPIARDLSERLRTYDELWVYDEMSKQAFEPYADAAGIRTRLIQGGYSAKDWKMDQRMRDWTGTFRFVMLGQLHARKNPMAAIKAFEQVHSRFPETELHLKTTVRGLHPGLMEACPGLHIYYDIWTPAQVKDLYAHSHCYVAPSWGEGKNLPALEAQTTGIPAIYSDIGGHRMWGSKEWGWPIPGTLQPAYEDGLVSFRIDAGALTEAMMEAVENRSLTRQKGALASRMIPAQCDWERVVTRMKDMLNT